MDDVIFLLFIVVLILCFIIVPIFVYKGKKNDNWTGVLNDKKINKYKHKGKDRIDYLLFFHKDTGKAVTYNVTEELYNRFEKGDKAAKTKGEYFPVKQ